MNISSKIAALTVVTLGVTTSGCHIYQKFEMPESSEITKDYVEATRTEADSTALGNLPWQEVFTDPVLVDLINQALANNTNVKNAKLNIDIAHANMQGARMSYLPSVALAPNGAGSSVAGSALSWTYQIPLSVSWEIDVFGKILNTKRSAEASYQQTQDYEQAVRSQIIGGVANCYYAISSLEAQLELQQRTAETWRQSVDVMKSLKEAGSTTEAAVVQSSAQYYGILGSIKDLETSIDEAHNTLSLLVGTMPQHWSIPSGQMLTLPTEFSAGVPMQALASRPDVRASERAVAIAYYATNSARAAFYPSLNITATGGFTNSFGSVIMNPGKWFYTLAGSLTAPLFSRGQNIARLKAAKAQQEQAMNNFEYSVMNAAAEVSNALTAYGNATEKQELYNTQVDYMSQAVDITETLFKNSATSYNTTYLEVLTAQQNLLSAQMGYISCRLARSQAIINLYQSLGGGR
jgi:NodT family efflux transporter outer membrane factor (OMF) lipoprotein